jgi:two-component system, cell cycle sensor histidine kinase and response regulator CckA
VAGVALDITEQTSLQEQLHLSQKLEAVGRLAGGVAHDFNNLLMVIQGNTDLLLLNVSEGDPAQGDLREIRAACERAAALTRQLLAFSRRQVLQPEVVDLNASLREMEKMLLRIIGEDVRLVTRLDPAAGRVLVDPGQIEQVVMNLALNARDAMPRGGELVITTRDAEITPRQAEAYPYVVDAGRYVEITVRDTGEGMDDVVRHHVFEPFFTTRKGSGGTGLGLATVYGIVKQSGGYVWVESEVGRGSCFRICLPRVDAPVADPAPRGAALPLQRGRGTVLVVEDEAAVRDVTRKILQSGGYRVLEAHDGGEALEICGSRAEPIDLVLTDVVMPGISGRELVDRLRPLRPEARFLYMSGYSPERVAGYGVGGGRPELIGKPFRPAALLEKVRTVLGG